MRMKRSNGIEAPSAPKTDPQTFRNPYNYNLSFYSTYIATMQALQQKAFVSGTAVQAKARVAAKSARCPVVVRAQKEEVSIQDEIYTPRLA